MENRGFQLVDWLLFGLTLGLSAVIGLYFSVAGNKKKTTSEYFTGDRKLWLIPTTISMTMSGLSAISIMGYTTEYYLYGVQTSLSFFASVIANIMAAVLIVPVLYKLRIISIFQYLHLRFNTQLIRRLCVFFQVLTQMFYMGLAIYTPSTSIEAITGFPTWANSIIITIVTTIYTTFGGMKGVIWTDMFQGVILLVGLIIIAVLGSVKVGGLPRVIELAQEGGRLNFFNFNPDPTVRMTFWSVVVAQLTLFVGQGTNQQIVQRYCSLPTLGKAKLSVLLLIPVSFVLTVLGFIVSLVMYAYYHSIGCDPLRSGQINNPNQLFTVFVVNVLGQPGIPGLFFAVLFSAVLSTISSSLNGLCAIIWKDLIEPSNPHMKEYKKLMITKGLVLVLGGVGLVIALVVELIPGTIFVILSRVLGGLAAPVGVILWLALLFPIANKWGAIVGAVGTFAFTMWMSIGALVSRPHRHTLPTIVDNCTANATIRPNPTDPPPGSIFWLYRVSHLLTGTFGLTVGVIVGVIASIIIGGRSKGSRDPRLVIPILSYLLCCLPKSVRKVLWCGVDHDNVPKEEINLDMEYQQEEALDSASGTEMNFVSGPVPSISSTTDSKAGNGVVGPVSLSGSDNKAFLTF